MKRFLLCAAALMMIFPPVFAGGGNKQKQAAAARAKQPEGIRWLTFEQAQEAMKQQPKKVWIDIYTDWCGWCKKMDATTFSNPYVIEYMNEHFYCIRFNAEAPGSILFMGKTYDAAPGQKTSQLAVELTQGNLTYPSSVFMQENFQNPMPAFAGYQDVRSMELILTYLAKEKYKTTPFEHYQRDYVPSWPVDNK